MKKKRDSVLLIERNSAISNETRTGINSTSPEIARSLDPDVLRRCNSLPIFISNNMYCKWNQKSKNNAQSRFVSSDFNSQSVYLLDTSILNSDPFNLETEPKSLQELQTEVDALKEFRNIVIETFPDLKTKIRSMHYVVSSSPSQRNQSKKKRMRKKLHNLNALATPILNPSDVIGEALPPFVSRSRSYPNCCKKEPKSCEGSGSAVQDSGFSTESSKDGFSASASSSGLQVGTNLSNHLQHDSDDELLNLLDVISRKTLRFRRKLPSFKNFACDKHETYSPNILSSRSWRPKVLRFERNYPFKENLIRLSRERDKLLVKVAELESEIYKNRIKITKMETKFEFLTPGDKNLQHQLKTSNQNQESNVNFFLRKCDGLSNTFNHAYLKTPPPVAVIPTNPSGTDTISTGILSKNDPKENTRPLPPTTCQPKVLGFDVNCKDLDIIDTIVDLHPSTIELSTDSISKDSKTDIESLGKIDGILCSSKLLREVQDKNSNKIAAILLEANPLELQRHLLMLTVENQMKRFNPQQSGIKFAPLQLKNKLAQLPLQQVHNTSEYRNNYSSTCSLKQLAYGERLNYGKDEPVKEENFVHYIRSCENKARNVYTNETSTLPAKQPKPSKIPLLGSKTLNSLKGMRNESNNGKNSRLMTKKKQ